jgi:putative ABC transport system ATP-binding protein
MMHEGRIIYNVAGEEKKYLKVEDLLRKFEQASGGQFANDRMMLAR